MKTYIAMLNGTDRRIGRARNIRVAVRKLARSLVQRSLICGYTEYSPALAECYIDTPLWPRQAGFKVHISECS